MEDQVKTGQKIKTSSIKESKNPASNSAFENEERPNADEIAAPHHDTQSRNHDFDPNVDSAKGSPGETFQTDTRPLRSHRAAFSRFVFETSTITLLRPSGLSRS